MLTCVIYTISQGQGQIDVMTMSDHEMFLKEAFCDLN